MQTERIERNSFVGVLQALRNLGWTPASIIDLGVGAGTPGLYTTWPGVPICLVEPSPGSADLVDQIAQRFDNVKVYKVGASNRSGTMRVRQDGTGYFVSFGAHKTKWREIEVPVMTCDEIVADAGLKGPFLYKLDTDAHEIEILEGSSQTLKDSEVCIIEVNFLYPVIGMPGPGEITQVMADNGFTIYDVSAISYSVEGVPRCADFVFIRRDSDLFRRVAWKRAAKPPQRLPLDQLNV
jgi:FkbM family methyltransferase